jgi:Tol biopolymer transport system component
MTPQDAFGAWLQGEAEEPIPEGELDRALILTAARQPRPAPLARLGSHWVTDAPPGAGRMTRLALRPLWAVVVLLLALALATVALLVGSRTLDRPGENGLLVYQLGSDLYLAEVDGGNLRQLAIRAGDRPLGPCTLSTTTGSIWAPNGRFFLCFGGPPDGANIVDSEGRLVASIPDMSEDATWSPNSDQLQAWIGPTRIGIYGADGALDASLSLPDGYTRMTGSGAAWAGDGRSVVVQIHLGAGVIETWRLQVDGSAPSPIDEDDPLANPDFSFTRDGGQMAFTRGIEHDRALYVANADGTEVRVVRQGERTPFGPIWSPDGAHIVFASVRPGVSIGYGIVVVDVLSESYLEPIPGLVHDVRPIFGWSAAGSRILLPRPDDRGRMSLWGVNVDGTDPRLLVEGATVGAWQPHP